MQLLASYYVSMLICFFCLSFSAYKIVMSCSVLIHCVVPVVPVIMRSRYDNLDGPAPFSLHHYDIDGIPNDTAPCGTFGVVASRN